MHLSLFDKTINHIFMFFRSKDIGISYSEYRFQHTSSKCVKANHTQLRCCNKKRKLTDRSHCTAKFNLTSTIRHIPAILLQSQLKFANQNNGLRRSLILIKVPSLSAIDVWFSLCFGDFRTQAFRKSLNL